MVYMTLLILSRLAYFRP